ncbi:MAG: ATP phosphoribosyltransferase regulatory subunit [Deferribacterales bacterium]
MGKISEVISLYGYSEIFLPIYEYYDLLADVTYNFNDENIIRFIDRYTGKSLVLRPDFTPQVCRIVANYLTDMPLPLRLSYNGRVFRNVGVHKGVKSEKFQVGCEIFGSDEFNGDLELLLIIRRVMDKLNINDYKIIIGDKKYISIVSKLINNEKLLRLLEAKNFTEIDKISSAIELDENISNLLRFLPEAFGDISILDKLEKLSFFSKELVERVSYIRSLMQGFFEFGGDKEKVIFDASETRGLNYYTGINIEIVSNRYGVSLGGGGRYDNLMSKFGYDISASGIAFNVDDMVMLCQLTNDLNGAIKMSKDLREAEILRDNGEKVFLKEK